MVRVSSLSGAPRPAEVSLPEVFCSAEQDIVRHPADISQLVPLCVEVGALGVDAQRAVANPAFVGRRARCTEKPPLVAVLGSAADDFGHLEIAPAQLELDLAHELRLASDGPQHFGQEEALCRGWY